jgi:hypothetical protein
VILLPFHLSQLSFLLSVVVREKNHPTNSLQFSRSSQPRHTDEFISKAVSEPHLPPLARI